MNEETAICTICKQPLGENGRCPHCDDDAHIWTIQDWRPLLSLAMVIVLAFSFTRLVVTAYNDRQDELAKRYYATGEREMQAARPAKAVDAFETALVYSHGNFDYSLKLVDALAASGETGQAVAQLHAYWDQRPTDAQVNLKLARLEAKQKHVDEALGFYEDAIEGVWPERTDPVPQRIEARFEAAEYLVELGRHEQAEGALEALAAMLPSNSKEQGRLASLLLRNGDPKRALTLYQAQLNVNKADSAALKGATEASFSTGNYAAARHYLQELKPESADSQALLERLQRMEALDPFAPGATERVRTERTVAAFLIAIDRLAACGVPFAQKMTGNMSVTPVDAAQWSGFQTWVQQLSPLMSERKLRGRDDVIESAMRFAFQAEMTAQKGCGKTTLNDEALLLLARERLGASQ